MNKLLKIIQADLKDALKTGNTPKVSTLRMLLSAIHNKEIEKHKRGKLSDEEVLEVIQSEVRQRRESIRCYKLAHRTDLVEKEKVELLILQNYLPKPLSDSELKEIIAQAISAVGAKSTKDLGKVMGVVMKKVGHRAEGKTVSKMVREALA